MNMKKRPWLYISIGGIAFSLGAIIYGIATGEYVVIARLVLLLGLSIYFFARELRLKQIEAQQNDDKTTRP